MKVCILGASGFVGGKLVEALSARGDTVVAASLRDPDAAAGAAAGCDAVVNLAGEPIGQRWNDDVKRKILESRTQAPQRFLDALRPRGNVPPVYVSASAVGYYGPSDDATFVESDAPGDDFLAHVCQAWERTAMGARDLGMRVAIARCGLVLGTQGGALAKMLPPFRLGAGGVVGSGKQWYSWVHVADLAGIYLALLDGGDGAYNATAPNPVRNADFTHALGETLHKPTALPIPAFALQMMLGEGAVVVTTGQRVLPQRLEREGRYAFAFATVDAALRDLLD